MALNTRALATRVILAVLHGQSIGDALQAAECPARDKAFVQALSYGTIRWYFQLELLLEQLLVKPLRNKDQDIRVLAMVGIYQLEYMRIKPHAAVSETVAACGRKTWARSLVNAVLRRYQREGEALKENISTNRAYRFSCPPWIDRRLSKDWPSQVDAILEAGNRQAPMVLRVNQTKTSRDSYIRQIEEAGFLAQKHTLVKSAVVLETPIDVDLIPGFRSGVVSVQDAAAQLAAELLDVQPGHRVLDLCAAPGGKTCHIMEQQADIAELVAVDVEQARLARITENLRRIGLEATLLRGDAAKPDEWWDGQRFQRILVDAPCSASGVIRRHPDIKLLRRGADIAQLVELQRHIMNAAWEMLEPGGLMLYATCSVFRDENDRQIADFCTQHDDAKEQHIDAAWGVSSGYGRQIFPGELAMDGFYYARLIKSK